MTPPTQEQLDAMIDAVEELLRSGEEALLIIATPRNDGGAKLSIVTRFSDPDVKIILAALLRRPGDETPIPEGSAH